MKKINIIKENRDFRRIMNQVKPYKNKDFLLFVEKSKDIKIYKFGISVSKKIGNAVTRNRLKRQIKSIIDKKVYQNNFNCIIILKKEILQEDYISIQNSLFDIISKIDIILGEEDEKED